MSTLNFIVLISLINKTKFNVGYVTKMGGFKYAPTLNNAFNTKKAASEYIPAVAENCSHFSYLSPAGHKYNYKYTLCIKISNSLIKPKCQICFARHLNTHGELLRQILYFNVKSSCKQNVV